MHRSYRFDARAALRGGANRLTVSFRSALEYAEEMERRLGARPHVNAHPFNMIRKMACSFGWDWGPDLQTAGIWQPVRLERWTTARLAGVRPLVTVGEDGAGRVELHATVEHAGPHPGSARAATGGRPAGPAGSGDATGAGAASAGTAASAGDAAAASPAAAPPGDAPPADLLLTVTVAGREGGVRVPAGATEAVITLDVPDIRLWWPAGHGEQPLYALGVELRPGDGGPVLDSAAHRVGFRTITVDTTPDDIGTPFTLVVNGRPLFAKGANWIPDDHFLTRVTRERLDRRIGQALGAHMNLLRVWGGGRYESEDFYDLCDERGVLVWQDFAFACASYPEEEPLWSEVEAEAREQVTRLSPHPSLALWNGANENLWGHRDWGWPERLQGRTWGLRYYTELLPAIVAGLDPTRGYAANSPYSPGLPPDEVHPNDADHGTRHEWRVWNELDYTAYRDHIPRFCSEFGFQAPPTTATLADWIHDEPLTATSPAFLLHQKAEDGHGKLERGYAPHLPRPAGFADWHWTTQLNQARAVAFGVEHFRSWWPRTAGSVVWQLNDCWPVTSWAAIDSGERPKPLWYALRHAYAPRLLTVQPRDGVPVLAAVNDTDEPWTGAVAAVRQAFDGTVLATATIELDVAPRAVATHRLAPSLLTPADPTQEVLVLTPTPTPTPGPGAARAVHLFAEDRELAYAPDPLTARVTPVPGGYRIDVRAASFARDIAVLADRLAPDAVVDDMLVSLPAGERHSFTVRTAARPAPEQLTGALVLRTANALCAPAVSS
ncbi:glycoside hydrolase family 2 protein [Streptomyces sp. PLAI1-29]|uniref:beta-mannosidase n=2 Tax=Streptomyces zingiberis TaxID=2053010 RepID=A0ABX1BUG8_9ACTN|nr:glycoside hydrolase family 2 protein [Streptomyces zingiberis]